MIEKAEMWKHGQVKCQEWVGIAFYGGWAWGLVGVDGNIYNDVRYCHFTRTRAVFFLLQNIFRDFERFWHFTKKFRTCDKWWEWVGVAILGGRMMRELEDRCTGTERWTVHGERLRVARCRTTPADRSTKGSTFQNSATSISALPVWV